MIYKVFQVKRGGLPALWPACLRTFSSLSPIFTLYRIEKRAKLYLVLRFTYPRNTTS